MHVDQTDPFAGGIDDGESRNYVPQITALIADAVRLSSARMLESSRGANVYDAAG
jgi:hypothetical protein